MRNQILNELHSAIPNVIKMYQFDAISLYQATGKADAVYLGYKISLRDKTHFVYLPYMNYSEEDLIPLTPIWTVETVTTHGSSFRGYDHLDYCLDAVVKFNNGSINRAI